MLGYRSPFCKLFNSLFASSYDSVISKLSVYSLKSKLGSGQFGEVYEGNWLGDEGEISVAVKILKEEAKEEDRIKFLQEAAIMGQFRDPNMVTIHGIVHEDESVESDN